MSLLSDIKFPKTVFVVLSTCVLITLLLVPKKDLISNWNLVKTSKNSSKAASGYVTSLPTGNRLANEMFNFAVLFYVGAKTGREVVLFHDQGVRLVEKYFRIGVRKVNRSCPCFTFAEKLVTYDIRIEEALRSQSANNSRTIVLQGVFVSWKYIQPVEHIIRAHMKFHKNIEDFARDILRKSIPKGWTEGRFTRVGIHNRRGDFLDSDRIEFGFTTAPESYFKKAMKYFADRYKLVQFIVASNDMKWSREHITYVNQSSSVNVTFSSSEKHSAAEDMAILSLCDHVIISTGSFGYMAAWLANGTTIYYSNFPRNGSKLSTLYNRLDYYPPHWIPME